MIVERQLPLLVVKQTELSPNQSKACSTFVGQFHNQCKAGQIVGPNSIIGEVLILDERFSVQLADDVPNMVVDECHVGIGLVEFDQQLLTLSAFDNKNTKAVSKVVDTSGGIFVRSPQPGRVYLQPAPGEDSYVQVGQTISNGDLLLLIEIMKTFTPLNYSGAQSGLPERAKIKKILVKDGAEIEQNSKIFELEAL